MDELIEKRDKEIKEYFDDDDTVISEVKSISKSCSNVTSLSERDIEMLRSSVIQYSKVNELMGQIKKDMLPYKEQIKKLSETKKNIEKDISDYMEMCKLQVCNLPKNEEGIRESAIKLCKVSISETIPRTKVKENLLTFFDNVNISHFNKLSNEQKALVVYEFIYAKKTKEVSKIKTVKAVNNDINKEYIIDEI